MSQTSFEIQPFGALTGSQAVVFVTDRLVLPEAVAIPAVQEALTRLAPIEKFKGKAQTAMTLTGVSGAPDKVVVIGLGDADEAAKTDFMTLGGLTAGKLGVGDATVVAAGSDGAFAPAAMAQMALGMRLRAYSFDKYKTKKGDDDEKPAARKVTFQVADSAAAKKALKPQLAVADGVELARNLVNEPPNILYPETFAKRAKALKELGVDVEVLGEKELKKIGMRALLGVGQGSHNESQVVIMRWNGAKDEKAQPVAFIGKGVTFDTGGISIKPAGGMEDMKGDMGGAACVTGLMHALAARKAKVNAIGVIGLVENMPDGKAQRPGDIVTSLSGQTIEIINTDAEGRLVLADVLWHVQAEFKPKFMIDLATLTGAIMVALGQERAGLFSNNDELAGRIHAAGEASGELVWRMPLGKAYDKIIDSKFADVKNSGGRYGGSITAAQFLQRFVNNCPWAHLDIAGTAMGSPQTETNRSWGSGYGVRLLDRLVADHYEDK
ncbi:MAG: leucyl aminopeptidase [Beijerinckiaceae bacterium]